MASDLGVGGSDNHTCFCHGGQNPSHTYTHIWMIWYGFK